MRSRWPPRRKSVRLAVDMRDAPVDGDTDLPSNRHVLQIHGLAVDPYFRRAGIGQDLIGHAIEEARRRGASKVWLFVLEPNAAARALYLRCGFELVGVLRDEFRLEEHSVDDMLMERHL